jgi:tetratricopeptide (TPR) repeat protein
LDRSGKFHILMAYCIQVLILVTSVNAGVVNTWISEGNKYLNAKSYEEALSYYNRALQADPNNIVALHQKGAVFYGMGRLEDALGSFGRVLEIDPNFITSLAYQASVLQKLNRFPEANASFQRADRIAGQWQIEAQELWNSGNYQRALVYCDMLLYHKKWNDWAWNMKGLCLCSLGNHNEALSCYDNSLEDFHNDHIVLFNKAECLLALERHEEAIELYDKVLQIDPDYVRALQSKANALEAIGKHNEADTARKRIRTIQRKAQFVGFTNRVRRHSGQVAIIAVILGVCCLLTGLLTGTSWAMRAGLVSMLVSCTGVLVWLGARWNWIPMILVLGVVGSIVLLWLLFGTRWPGDWPLWWEHWSVRQTLLWKYSTGPAKKDAALRLGGSTIKADIKALIYALRDPEVSTTAASVLRAIGPDADVIRTLRKALASEKDDSVKKALAAIIEQYQIGIT